MSQIIVNICDRNGTYPKNNVHSNDIGYFVYKNIPFLYSLTSDRIKNKAFDASLVLARKHFPVFYIKSGSINIYLDFEKQPNGRKVISKVKKVIDGKYILPQLFDPYQKYSFKKAQKLIKQMREKKEYIDLFRHKKLPFKRIIIAISNDYQFSTYKVDIPKFNKLFKLFLRSSRHIHIALHYFVNAANLMHNGFIEDSGLNMNLSVEAIIKDFMVCNAIKDKSMAIARFMKTVKLPSYHMENIRDLYKARNEYLAHIDEYMFTDKERISDPDQYCYEHFESLYWLITRYVTKRNSLRS